MLDLTRQFKVLIILDEIKVVASAREKAPLENK